MVVFQIKTYCTAEIRRLIPRAAEGTAGGLKEKTVKCGRAEKVLEERGEAPRSTGGGSGSSRSQQVLQCKYEEIQKPRAGMSD